MPDPSDPNQFSPWEKLSRTLMKSNKDYNELKDSFIDPSEHWKLRKMILHENYRVEFGIAQQTFIDNNLFGAITRTDVDNVTSAINYQTLMGEFIDIEVFKYTGISLDEYISMPINVRDDIKARIRRLTEEKGRLVDNLLSSQDKEP